MTTCFQSGETFSKGCGRASSGVSLSSHGTAQRVRALLVRQRAFSTCTTFEPLKTFKRFLSRHRNPFTCVGILIRHIFLSTASTLTTFLTSPHLFSYPISLCIFLSAFFRLEEISMFHCALSVNSDDFITHSLSLSRTGKNESLGQQKGYPKLVLLLNKI